MSDVDLLPCPFCEGKAERRTLPSDEFGNEGGDVIECSACHASSHVEFGAKENLVDAWNSRAPASAPADIPETAPDLIIAHLGDLLAYQIERAEKAERERNALAAQPVAQEPVAWVDEQELRYLEMVTGNKGWGTAQRSIKVGGEGDGRAPLYAHPATPAPDDLVREIMDLREALNPPRSGPDAWCQPMDCGKHTPRVWVIRFEDQDVPDLVFDNEADARLKFTRVNRNWNCHLLASLPLSPATPAPVEAGLADEAEYMVGNPMSPPDDMRQALIRCREIALQSEAAPLSMCEIIKRVDLALQEETPLPSWITAIANGDPT